MTPPKPPRASAGWKKTLKWGQPSYLTPETKSGSTIRIDRVKSAANQYAVYFHCQTDLVETFRELYPDEFSFGGNRCIILNADDELHEAALRHCVALALTYHLNRRKCARGYAVPRRAGESANQAIRD